MLLILYYFIPVDLSLYWANWLEWECGLFLWHQIWGDILYKAY